MEKKRYKMYKKGKHWVIAPIVFFGAIGGLMLVTAQPQSTHAAEIEVAAKDTVAEETTASEATPSSQEEATVTEPAEAPIVANSTSPDSTAGSIENAKNNDDQQSEPVITAPASSTAVEDDVAQTDKTADEVSTTPTSNSTVSENRPSEVEAAPTSADSPIAAEQGTNTTEPSTTEADKDPAQVQAKAASSDPVPVVGAIYLDIFMKSEASTTKAGMVNVYLTEADLSNLDQLTYGKLMTLALANRIDSTGQVDHIRVISIFSSYNNGTITAEDAIAQLGEAWPGASISNKETLDVTINDFFSQLKGYTIDDLALKQLLDQPVALTELGTNYYLANPLYIPFITNNFSATIHYQYADGTSAAEDRIVTGYKGQQTVTINSPLIEGYVPDKSQLSIDFTTSENKEYTVTYVKEAAQNKNVSIHFVDVSDPTKDLKPAFVLENQKIGSMIDLTKVGLDTIVDGYTLQSSLNSQYLVQGDTDNIIYLLYIKNLTETETKEVTRTIHYQSSDGSEVPKDVKQTVTFTREIVKDANTGDILSTGDWQADQASWAAVETPSKARYTADKAQIAEEKVTPEIGDQTETVTYTPNGQKTETETKEITRTIHYQSTDGSQVPKDVVQTVRFTREITKDAVTGDILSTGDWQADQTEWPEVKTPEVAGYTITVTEVAAVEVSEAMGNQTVNVIYTPENPDVPTPDDKTPEDKNTSGTHQSATSGIKGVKVNSAAVPTESKTPATHKVVQASDANPNKKQTATMLANNTQETSVKSYPKTGEDTSLSSLLAGLGVLLLASIGAAFRFLSRKN